MLDSQLWTKGAPVVAIDVGDGALELAPVLSVWPGEGEHDIELMLDAGTSLDNRPASIRRGDRYRLADVMLSTRAPVGTCYGGYGESVWVRLADGQWATVAFEVREARAVRKMRRIAQDLGQRPTLPALQEFASVLGTEVSVWNPELEQPVVSPIEIAEWARAGESLDAMATKVSRRRNALVEARDVAIAKALSDSPFGLQTAAVVEQLPAYLLVPAIERTGAGATPVELVSAALRRMKDRGVVRSIAGHWKLTDVGSGWLLEVDKPAQPVARLPMQEAI